MPDMRIPRAPRARFASTCSACGDPIAEGDAIVRHVDSRKYVHSKCQFLRAEPMTPLILVDMPDPPRTS